MSISRKLKIIIPRPPKAGSTSTATWLMAQDKDMVTKDTEHHEPLDHYIDNHKIDLKDYTILHVGRNPFQRQISAYEFSRFTTNHAYTPLHRVLDVDFKTWYMNLLMKHIYEYDEPLDGEHNFRWDLDPVFFPQTSFTSNRHDAIHAEFIQIEKFEEFRLEKYPDSPKLGRLNAHNNREGQSYKSNSNANVANYKVHDWTHYYTDMDIVRKMQALYSDDFSRWGYDPNINPWTEELWNL
jgi:hypothetical protein